MEKEINVKKSFLFRCFVDKIVSTKVSNMGKKVSTYLVYFICYNDRKMTQVVTPMPSEWKR